MANASEHRHSKRVELSARVHVQASGTPEEILLSYDWTDRSVFLRTLHPLPLGVAAKLSVVIPHEPEPVKLQGTVTRVVAADHNAPTRPPGMAVQFGPMPAVLKAHLAELLEHSAIKTVIEAKSVPPVLVIAERTSDRLTAVHTLEEAGYDVTEAHTASSLQSALILGRPYEAAVFIDDVKRGDLLSLMQRLSTDGSVDIPIDEPAPPGPTALAESLDCPLIVLPPDATAHAIRQAVEVHVRPTNVRVESLANASP